VNPLPIHTVTQRLNTLLQRGGAGFKLSLCPNAKYSLTTPLEFSAPNQEISTIGYPTGDARALLQVAGPVGNGTGHTTAVQATKPGLNGVILRNIQVDGNRQGASISGGATVEMGGPNTGQVVSYLRSFNPRSWSCLYIAEGNLKCRNTTVAYCDIGGPAGSDTFGEVRPSSLCYSSCLNDINSGRTGSVLAAKIVLSMGIQSLILPTGE
jgi:hypothetical protein